MYLTGLIFACFGFGWLLGMLHTKPIRIATRMLVLIYEIYMRFTEIPQRLAGRVKNGTYGQRNYEYILIGWVNKIKKYR